MERTLARPRSLSIHRWFGAAQVMGGLLFIVNKLDDMGRLFLNRTLPDLITDRTSLVVAAGQVLLVVGLLGCYLEYAGRCNRVGKIGLALLLGGGVLLALGHATFTPYFPQAEWLFIFVLLGVLLMVVGLTVFGAVNLRARALQHWQALPLATGLLGIAAFPLSNLIVNPSIFLLLRTLFGAGLVLMGVILWLDTRAAQSGSRV